MTGSSSYCETKPMGPRNFWIGLPVMLMFALVTWAGAYYAGSQVYLEWQVAREGIPVQAHLLKKFDLADSDRTTYHFRYSFQVDDKVVVNESRVDRDAYYSSREGEPLTVLYVPGDPERNLPAKREMSSFFQICGTISGIAALFFSFVCIGMIVKKLKGGYRGERTESEHLP